MNSRFRMLIGCVVCAGIGSLVPLCQAGDAPDPILDAIQKEVQRTVADLRLPDSPAPYFVACSFNVNRSVGAGASLGSLTRSDERTMAFISVNVRVGDYAFDNGNFSPKESWGGWSRLDWAIEAPIDGDSEVLRRNLWWAIDLAYKRSLENLKRKKSVLANRSTPPVADDFAKAPVSTMGPMEIPQVMPPITKVETQARRLSALMAASRTLRTGAVSIRADTSERWYVNSEGTRVHTIENTAHVRGTATAQADDGVFVGDSFTAYALSFNTLPAAATLEGDVTALAKRVEAMRVAPLLEDFVGPVLFEGEAAAELCARIMPAAFSSRRPPITEDAEMSQWMSPSQGNESLRRKIGRHVMATGFSVVDEPALAEFQGAPLLGRLQVDLEGVKPERVELVRSGILKTLLTTRTPDKKLPTSNGHAVGYGYDSGMSAQAGPTTLIVSYTNGLDAAALRASLLQTVKEQAADYGLVVQKIGVGGRQSYRRSRSDDAGLISDPLFAQCLYPDGTEKLVRVVSLKGMTFLAFKDVLAAGNTPYVLNTTGNGSSISVIAPSLLFEEGVVMKPERDIAKPPLLPSPLAGAAAANAK